MARPIPETALEEIIGAVRRHTKGATAQQIAIALDPSIKHRTLQYRLNYLVQRGRLAMHSSGRWATYHIPAPPAAERTELPKLHEEDMLPLSEASIATRDYLARPVAARKPVSYNVAFLDSYRPNVTSYFSAAERARLHELGTPQTAGLPAGTYAKQILNRLLIDLSWNSSRLEGNTYSLLDTRRLIEFGQEAEGRDQHEAQMILNHKDAIEFLVGDAEDIGFNRYTILNLHALLANNLLLDDSAAGRLRRITIGIQHSVFEPLAAPHLIEEYFGQILATAGAIEDPFEQALFIMVQLPYLQPFDDVNKRVSRLAANIPLIKANLSPLSFTAIPQSIYLQAILGIYELNEVALLKDVFTWAYERSAERYAAVRQSLGEPDSFLFQYRDQLRQLIPHIVRATMNRQEAIAHIATWSEGNIQAADRDAFREAAETELLGLHEGNFARYQVTPGQYAAWQEIWALNHV